MNWQAFEENMKKASQTHEAPVDPDALWEKMQRKRRRRFFVWWWWAGVFLLGLAGAGLWWRQSTRPQWVSRGAEENGLKQEALQSPQNNPQNTRTNSTNPEPPSTRYQSPPQTHVSKNTPSVAPHLQKPTRPNHPTWRGQLPLDTFKKPTFRREKSARYKEGTAYSIGLGGPFMATLGSDSVHLKNDNDRGVSPSPEIDDQPSNIETSAPSLPELGLAPVERGRSGTAFLSPKGFVALFWAAPLPSPSTQTLLTPQLDTSEMAKRYQPPQNPRKHIAWGLMGGLYTWQRHTPGLDAFPYMAGQKLEAWSLGAICTVPLRAAWQLRTGVLLNRQTSVFRWEFSKSGIKPRTVTNNFLDGTSNTSVDSSLFVTVVTTRKIQQYNHVTAFGIPVELQYAKTFKNRVTLLPALGIQGRIGQWGKGILVQNPVEGLVDRSFFPTHYRKFFGFSARAGVGCSFPLGKSWHLLFEPSAVWDLSSRANAEFKEHFSQYGLQVGIVWKK